MSFKNYNPHQRYKERAAHRLSSALAYLAVILISILIGFWFGKQYAAEQLILAQTKLENLIQVEKDQQQQITELSTKAQTADMRYEQLKDSVEETAPNEAARGLISLINEQIKKGIKPERLSYLIKSGRPPTGCVEPETKRFVVATPLYEGPKPEVVLNEGEITISGKGVSATGDKGKSEVWFDPAREVSISFAYEGKTETKKGVLPLQKTLVSKDREYRFTIEKGAQSSAKVIYDSCAYP